MEAELYRQMRELEDRHWWFAARRDIVGSILDTLDLPPDPRILDVGAGTGGNLEMLSRLGHVTGLEYDDAAAALARERGIARVLKGSLPDDLPFPPGEFHVIMLLDVLEHVEDDRSAVICLERLLAPGGFLVITVPACPFLWSYHDIQHHHKRRYRRRELKSLLLESGFRIRHTTFFNTWLFPVIVVTRLLRRMKSSVKIGEDTGMPSRFINGILQCIFSSERYLLGRISMPFGASLLAVAVKDRQK
jgi:SAM-dependent methyltransferase